MNYYENAIGWHHSANDLAQLGHYQQALYACCIAIELYLKSKLSSVIHKTSLERSHDVIGIYHVLAEKYGKNDFVGHAMPRVRKYFNESRYPSNPSMVFDQVLMDAFLDYVNATKRYIDKQCVITRVVIEDRRKRETKQ